MAIFKFYNIQLLPIDTKHIDEVGAEGYCQLFNSLGNQAKTARVEGKKLTSIAISMRGEMYFSPFSLETKEYASEDPSKPNKIIHGYFLRFDDIDELFDTNSGKSEYRSQGNTSSKRYSLEFVFDPICHVIAIRDTKGLPTRAPLIDALERILEPHAHRLFQSHSLTVDELTAADSLIEMLEEPKIGYKSFSAQVTFSNSDKMDHELENQLVQLASETEQELKDINVATWQSVFKSFKDGVMEDLPMAAKIQAYLATRYGNAKAKYRNQSGENKIYHMQDYPVREKLKEKEAKGILDRALEIKSLISKAIEKTRISNETYKKNKHLLDVKDKK